MTEKIVWPRKTREIHNHHFDSTIWNHLQFRDDDIIIATYTKSGTTWMQQIVAQLLYGPDPDLEVAEMSPWLDLRAPPAGSEVARGRGTDPPTIPKNAPSSRCAHFLTQSQVHLSRARRPRRGVEPVLSPCECKPETVRNAQRHPPGRVGPPIEPPPSDILQYWRDWLERDGYPFWSFWENVRTWWEIRHLPDVLFVHFANLKRDMPGQIHHIAAFLDIPINETGWDTILEYCSVNWMKQHASKSVPLGGAFWNAGAQVFINQGMNGSWAQTIPPEEMAAYEERAVRELGPECARWLATG